jgi:tetratricopeptide (TPR) repeat protein
MLTLAGAVALIGCAETVTETPEPEPTTYIIITATPGPTQTPAPTPDLGGLIEDSRASAQTGDAEGALAALEGMEAIGASTQARIGWVEAVSTLYGSGEYEKAAQLATAGSEYFPDDSSLLFMSGVTALTLDDTETAIVYLSEAVEVNPGDYRAWHLRGLAYLRQDEFEQAIPDLEQAITLGEEAGVMGSSDAFVAMADLAYALADEDPQAGLIYLAEKRGYYVNYEGVLSGALLAGQGRIWGQSDLTTDAALDVLNRAIQRNYVEGYYYRAEVWERIGEREKAIGDLETYLELRPFGLVSEWARDLLAELETA